MVLPFGMTVLGAGVTREIDEVEGSPGTGRDKADLWALVELFVLSGFAIAQPLLDVTGKSPDFFLFRRADRLDIVLLVLGVTLLPALAIWVVEVAGRAGQSGTVRRLLHLAAITGLFTLLAVEVAKKLTDLRGPVLVAIALVGGLLGAVCCTPGSRGRGCGCATWPRPRWSSRCCSCSCRPTSKLVLPAQAEPSVGGQARGGGRLRRAAAGGDDPVRRVPAQQPARLQGPDRQAGLPQLRRAGRPVDLVPQRHRGGRLHPLGACRRC